MCGIVGYIGNEVVDNVLIENLKLLEYRGYDSAGIAVLDNENIESVRAEGNISCLEKILPHNKKANVGIAHTRWATHGKPITRNAHPHLSNNKQWAIVHNRIVENYNIIKHSLIKHGYVFNSETDTEVIAHLLEKMSTENIMQTIINVCSQLEGSFALAIINSKKNKTLYLAKRKSPLYIAIGDGEVFVASDPICFAGKTQEYYSLNDNEFCEVNLKEIKFFNENYNEIIKETVKLNDLQLNFSKQNYEHYMLKEMEEVPSVINRIIATYKDGCVFEKINKKNLLNVNKIILVGCGTAYHAGVMGASFIENFARIDARAFIASEFRYSDPIIDDKTLAIFVSQSGETADTIMAHELAKKKGAITLTLTNVLYSTLAKNTDYVLPVCAGPEIAVASTKAYTAQITILNMFSKFLCNIRNKTNMDYISDIYNLAENIKLNQEDMLKELAQQLSMEKTAFFIGRGVDAITSDEASLKLKEITYINSQSYPAGELKHGFLALVEEGTFVFVIATQKTLLEKTMNGAHEAAARGAKIVLVSQFNFSKSELKDVYMFIKLKEASDDLMPIMSIGVFQKISYLTSIKKGINPDQPRNLAKSVTVE